MWRSISVAMLLLALAGLTSARGQPVDSARPSVGGVASLSGAMIFYVAKSEPDACGPGCSEWIAAEGTIQWDTYKRLLALLDRLGGRKLPVVLNVSDGGNLDAASSMGRIIRERGLDTIAAVTAVPRCVGATDVDCFALKRGGGPVDARFDTWAARCNLGCVFALAGGVHRALPAGVKVIVGGREIRNRLGLNISDERREGLQARLGDKHRLYLTQMGIAPEFMDIVDGNTERQRASELAPDDWARLRLVTGTFQ